MILTIITLLTALAIAGVAAWFSIIGLMAIFSAAPIPILIMGGVLELGKLTSASWLYRNWRGIPFFLKSYLTIAVVVLMLITSMGIFGFLSKAHIEQSAPVGNNIAKITRLEQRIDYEERQIVDFEKIIAQLDVAVDTLVKYDKISGDTGAIAVRTNQKSERAELSGYISAAQENINHFEDEKFELQGAVREFELEVGPLKYIAEMIYEDPESNLGSAVRAVIIIIIFVFDPLAVLLLIAANYSLQQVLDNKKLNKNSPKEVNTSNDKNDGETQIETETTTDIEALSGEPDEGWTNGDFRAEPIRTGGAESYVSAKGGDALSEVDTEEIDAEGDKKETGETAEEATSVRVAKESDNITDGTEEPIAKTRRWVNNGRRYFHEPAD